MPRILLVEDSPVDQHLIGTLLQRANWVVETACDGIEAWEFLCDNSVDVIITDLRMPRMDGFELVRKIREAEIATPVVLVTSHGSEELAVQALQHGATSFSPKKSLRNDLLKTVRKVLDMSQHMRYTHDPNWLPAPKHFAVVIENDLKLIGPLIEQMQLNLPSWSDRDRLQIAMAMDEALTNAMHHGNLEVESSLREDDENEYYQQVRNRKECEPFCHRKVKLEAEFSDRHICVQISDEGPGFNPRQIPDPTCNENVTKVSGRGLFLIRSFMDQVAHNRNGNQITMTKLRRE